MDHAGTASSPGSGPWLTRSERTVKTCCRVNTTASGSEQESPSVLETGREALQGCGILASNASLQPGQSITSCDGRFVLKMKSDGDLVLKRRTFDCGFDCGGRRA